MLYRMNLQVRAVVEMWSVKVKLSSRITQRFLDVLIGLSVVEPSYTVRLWLIEVQAGMTRSSVFAKLSLRWCSLIQSKMSDRPADIRVETEGSSGLKDLSARYYSTLLSYYW